jgi:membrane associated rhomboid family serine protease
MSEDRVEAPTCYRHEGRETWIRCQRCDRPICPDCMREAAVGYHCPACVAEGRRTTRQARGAYGGGRSANPALTSMVIIAVNAAVWIAVLLTGGSRSSLLPILAIRPDGVCAEPAEGLLYPAVGEAICERTSGFVWQDGVASGAWWQLLTSAFTHVDLVHIGFNMLALWFLGPQLEGVLGRGRFLLVYLGSAFTASAAIMLVGAPYSTTVGASGGVFGLLGALLVVALKVGGNIQPLLVWIGLNVLITVFGANISWQGHVGGMVGGATLAAILVYAPRARRTLWQVLGAGAVLAVALGVVVVRVLALS